MENPRAAQSFHAAELLSVLGFEAKTTMGWPVQSDYRDALQNPNGAFSDAFLKQCEVERNKMKVPRARSGAFASVYKLTHTTKTVALKLFNFASAEREGRYQKVSEYVEKLGAQCPQSLVAFRYDTQGIRIKKEFYPLQTMDWVKGLSLGEWVRQTVEEKKDAKAIRKMADDWGKLVLELQKAKISHGDLQHDNVMVVNDSPVLVDYDGMCVPGMEGLDQLEFGKPAYQHPERSKNPLSLEIDNFAAWVILVALRATAADLGLYQKFVTAVSNENLLFSPDDLLAPNASKLWPAVMALPDPGLREWATALQEACNKPFNQIPKFALAPSDPFIVVRELAAAAEKDWTSIAAETDALRDAGKALPPNPPGLTALADEARKRVAARNRLQKAVDDRDTRQMVAAYDAKLLDGWREAAYLVDQARGALQQNQVLDKLKALAASPGDGRTLISLWRSSARQVTGLAETATYQSLAETWEKRIAMSDRFRAIAREPQPSEIALAAAWVDARRAGLHPELTPVDRQRGEQAERRAASIRALQIIPKTFSEDVDRRLISAWDETLLKPCPDAAAFLPLVETARRNLECVAAIEKAILAGGQAKAIVDAAKPLLVAYAKQPYAHKHFDRVQKSFAIIKGFEKVDNLVKASPPSDMQIAAAWEEYERAHPSAASKVPNNLSETCRQSVHRRDAMAEFARLDKTITGADRQDVKWLETWKRHASLLTGRADVKRIKSRLELAERRYTSWNALKKALESHDFDVIRQSVENPELAEYPPMFENREQIGRLFDLAVKFQHLQDNLRCASGAKVSPEDLDFLRENSNVVGPPLRQKVEKLIEAHLASTGRLMPANPPFQVMAGPFPLVKVAWAWSDSGIVTYCLIAHDRAKNFASPQEADPYATTECRVEDHRRAAGTTLVSPLSGGDRLYVTIWAIVDLGWTTLHSPPLYIGPINLHAPGRR